jgi:2-polyprenyl-3-methyl-5-hydroxy-6-metoxy-1,4-benzoquinol methylase
LSVAPTPQPSPQLFFETINSYQRTEALKAAIELEVFTAIGEGNQTAAAIASRCKASERGTRILCDALVIAGFLAKHGERYSLTADSATFLDKRSPAYIGGAIGFLTAPRVMDSFKTLAPAVRKGGTVRDQDSLAPENPMWVEFARSMAPLMIMPAQILAKMLGADKAEKWKVLSLAAGHGTYEITIAKQNPNAEVWAVDWANVLQVAQENARAAGVSSRYHTIPGSAFDVDYGTGYDVVLITNILHHFDPPTSEVLLRKVHRALKDGGRAVILEFVPNEDRISPPHAAWFSLTMLVGTPAGDAYPYSELKQMLTNTGYRSTENHPMPPTFFNVVIGVK